MEKLLSQAHILRHNRSFGFNNYLSFYKKSYG